MIDRDRRFELLAQGDADVVMALAEAILITADVEVLTAPRVGTLMMRHHEPVAGTLFNVGEVLVTEAMVSLNGCRGYAMRPGREPEATLAAAIVDAAAEASPMLAPHIELRLVEFEAAHHAAAVAAEREAARTRVVFDVMAP